MASDRWGRSPIDESATQTTPLPAAAEGSDATVTSPFEAPSGGPPSTTPSAAPFGQWPPPTAAGPPAPGTAVALTADPGSPPRTNGTEGGGTPSLATGTAPSSPPTRHRPDAAASPTAPPATPAPSLVAPPPVQSVTPGPGWGWRALVAFVAGGLLTGAGFAIAQLDGGDDTAAGGGASVEATEATTTSTATTGTSPPATVAPNAANPAAAVAETLGPSVVQVETNLGIGSGVIYDDGLILTNHHVIDRATQVRIQLKDGRRLPAEVLGSDEAVDIAVVSVGPGEDLPIAPLATGEHPVVGQVAIAIGSPFQLQQTVTEGIVSAVNRPVPTGGVYTAMIQTDAPINPGNSGGALADSQGRVIGINTAIQTDGNSNTNAGIGFAIPIDTAISVADRIVAGIPIQAGFLGVEGGQSIDGAAGVQITAITEGSAAEVSGLLVGDLIVAIDGAPVTAFEELAGLVVAQAPGDVVELDVVRNGQPLTLEATLGARDD